MAAKKHPEPFWRAERNCYFVQIGKKQHRLSPDEAEAWRLYHELMAKPPEAPKTVARGESARVVQLLDAFLDWVAKNKAPRTYDSYRENIQRFAGSIPAKLTVAQLKPFHVTQSMSDCAHWSNNTKNDFISSIKRALNWAMDEGLIDQSPLARMKKPAREAREMAISPAEYATIIEAVEEPCFRDLIELAWETGARVQELRQIEARYLDLASNRIVFPPKVAKGKKYHRVIYLTGRAKEILLRLAGVHRTGPLLLTSAASAWTKDSINSAFCRLQVTLGRRKMRELSIAPKKPTRFKPATVPPEHLAEARAQHQVKRKAYRRELRKTARKYGPKYHLGAFRKGYASEALKAGLDTVTVAHLLGHKDATMISRVYGRVQQDPVHMAAAARKAKKDVKAGGDASA
jgi:integrase